MTFSQTEVNRLPCWPPRSSLLIGCSVLAPDWLLGSDLAPDWLLSSDLWLVDEPAGKVSQTWWCIQGTNNRVSVSVTQHRLLDPELADAPHPLLTHLLLHLGVCLGLAGPSDLDWLINGLDGSQLVRLEERRLLVWGRRCKEKHPAATVPTPPSQHPTYSGFSDVGEINAGMEDAACQAIWDLPPPLPFRFCLCPLPIPRPDCFRLGVKSPPSSRILQISLQSMRLQRLSDQSERLQQAGWGGLGRWCLPNHVRNIQEHPQKQNPLRVPSQQFPPLRFHDVIKRPA